MIDRVRRVRRSLGRDDDAASATGTAHAKADEHLARFTTTLAGRIDAAISSRVAGSAYTSALALALDRYLVGNAQVLLVRPDGQTLSSVTAGGSAWAYGSYVEVAAANDLAAHMLVGLIVYGSGGDAVHYQVQIATGGAGSEVVKTATALSEGAGNRLIGPLNLPFPIEIPANARVAVRVASSTASSSITIGLMFIARPA